MTDEQELRGKDGKLCGKVRDKRYLVIRRGKKTDVFDLRRIVDREREDLKPETD